MTKVNGYPSKRFFMKKEYTTIKKLIVEFRELIKELRLGTNILYYSRQMTCFMFVICYVIFLKYIPEVLPKVIHVRTYINNPELDIYLNFHALFLIVVFISIYIALKPIEKRLE